MENSYFSSAQLARSIVLQRLLQNGISGPSNGTSFLQIGQRTNLLSNGDSVGADWLRAQDLERVRIADGGLHDAFGGISEMAH